MEWNFKESQTQPLCRIGIGVDASSSTLDGVSFDDPLSDDARYYIVKTYSLTTTASVGGSISPSVGEFNEGIPVKLAAYPDLGYAFSHWTGDHPPGSASEIK